MKNTIDRQKVKISFDITITIPVDPEYSTSSQRKMSHYIDISDALNNEYVSNFVTLNTLQSSPHPKADFDVKNICIYEVLNEIESCTPIKVMDGFKIHNINYSIQ